MFRFPQLLQVNGRDIHRIRHHPSPAGQDNVEEGVEQLSSWDRTSQPVDKARDAKTFQNQFRMVVAAIIFEFLLNITLFVSSTNEHITRSRTETGTGTWDK